jgi:hypothetical protein
MLLLVAGLTCLLGALAVAGGVAALLLGDRVEGQPPGDCAAGDVIAFLLLCSSALTGLLGAGLTAASGVLFWRLSGTNRA